MLKSKPSNLVRVMYMKFVTNCKNYSFPQLERHLKGYSSSKVRKAFPAEMSYFLWGKSYWSDGNFFMNLWTGHFRDCEILYWTTTRELLDNKWDSSNAEKFHIKTVNTQGFLLIYLNVTPTPYWGGSWLQNIISIVKYGHNDIIHHENDFGLHTNSVNHDKLLTQWR